MKYNVVKVLNLTKIKLFPVLTKAGVENGSNRYHVKSLLTHSHSRKWPDKFEEIYRVRAKLLIEIAEKEGYKYVLVPGIAILGKFIEEEARLKKIFPMRLATLRNGEYLGLVDADCKFPNYVLV